MAGSTIDRRLSSSVAREGAVTNGDVRTLLAVDSVEARSMLQSLVSQGILVRQGERGGSEYLLARDIGVPARIRHTDAELDEIALTMATDRPLTNAGLRAEPVSIDKKRSESFAAWSSVGSSSNEASGAARGTSGAEPWTPGALPITQTPHGPETGGARG